MDELRRIIDRIDGRSPEQTIIDNIQDLADTAVSGMKTPDALRILKTGHAIIGAAIDELESAEE